MRRMENPFERQPDIQEKVGSFYSKAERGLKSPLGRYLTMAALALSTQACGRFMANVPGVGNAESGSVTQESSAEKFTMRWQNLPEGLYLPEVAEEALDVDKTNESGGTRRFVEYVKISKDEPRPTEASYILQNKIGEGISEWYERGFAGMVYYSDLTDSYNLRVSDRRMQSQTYNSKDMRRLDERRPLVDLWSRNWPAWLASRTSPTSPPIDYPSSYAEPNIKPTELAAISAQDERVTVKMQNQVAAAVLGQVQGPERAQVFQEVESVLKPRNVTGLITLGEKQEISQLPSLQNPETLTIDQRAGGIINSLLTINQATSEQKLHTIQQIISSTPEEQGSVYAKDLRFLLVDAQHSDRFAGRVNQMQIIFPIPIPDPNIDESAWKSVERGAHVDPKQWEKMSDEAREASIKQMKQRMLAARQKLIDEAKEIKLQSINKALQMYLSYVQSTLVNKYGAAKARQMLSREPNIMGTDTDYKFMFARMGGGEAMMVVHVSINNPLVEPQE